MPTDWDDAPQIGRRRGGSLAVQRPLNNFVSWQCHAQRHQNGLTASFNALAILWFHFRSFFLL